jgi:DNA (cytosine-5)-methyltransferase 1
LEVVQMVVSAYVKSESYPTITDLFCGAGGSSLGGAAAGGEVKLALNHWPLAIQTPNTNFPDTRHDCVDISSSNPKRYPSSTILMASPECTHHSQARGKKREIRPQLGLWDEEPPSSEETDRSRATMFDVPRFAECMLDRGSPYNFIIVENVIEVHDWLFFDDWLKMMQKLDYKWNILSLNSQHFQPVPQSRDRLYVVFWRRGNPAPDLNFYPTAFCERCGGDVASVQTWKNPARTWGRYGKHGQYVYRCPTSSAVVTPYYYAAANAIDWKLPMTRVGERQKPLKPRMLHRIQLGIERFGLQSQLVELGHGSDSGHIRPLTDPYPTQTTAQSVGLFTPFIVGLDHTNGSGSFAHAVTESWPTQTARQDKALVVPYIIELRGTGTVREITQPLLSLTAFNGHLGVTGHKV